MKRKGGKKKPQQRGPQVRVNDRITAPELRVVTDDGENLGILSRDEAQKKAAEHDTDLVEISPKAEPPVAKIVDYGKYQYDQKKKQKEQKSRSKSAEMKNVQVKPATGEHDLEMKAKQTSKWLGQGHRVKVELFLKGRSKYMSQEFLQGRLDRFLNLITEDYKMTQEPKKTPKGLTAVIEKA